MNIPDTMPILTYKCSILVAKKEEQNPAGTSIQDIRIATGNPSLVIIEPLTTPEDIK